jgi:hypothetical protein
VVIQVAIGNDVITRTEEEERRNVWFGGGGVLCLCPPQESRVCWKHLKSEVWELGLDANIPPSTSPHLSPSQPKSTGIGGEKGENKF